MKQIKIKDECWAVMNVELNLPCMFIEGKGKDAKTTGPAIFVSDLPGKYGARQEAIDWKKEHLPNMKEIRVVECSITYSIPDHVSL